MTIAVVWPEDGVLWCAADTRLVYGNQNTITSEMAAKIYSIHLSTSAVDPSIDRSRAALERRQPHFWTQYGFVYAGAALPASQTAITASTLLQNLVRPGGRLNPPRFEEIAELVCRLSRCFMSDKRRLGADGLFQAALFGWCPHTEQYKVAYIDGRDDAQNFRVELSYPDPPKNDGDPWIILGSGASTFAKTLAEYHKREQHITKHLPRRAIDQMIAEEQDQSVGGATSIGAAHEHGFELFYAVEPMSKGASEARRVFNGLDLDIDIGPIGEYFVAATGIA